MLITLTTNRSGNFFTRETLTFQGLRAQVSLNGTVKQQMSLVTSADCPTCHNPNGSAGGRLFLD